MLKSENGISKESFEAAYNQLRQTMLKLQDRPSKTIEEISNLLAFYTLEKAILDRRRNYDTMTSNDIMIIRMFDLLQVDLEQYQKKETAEQASN